MSDPATPTDAAVLPATAPTAPTPPPAAPVENEIAPLPVLPLAALDSLRAYPTPLAPNNGEPPCKKIYIGSLPETATLADLEDCFGQLGKCTCSLKRGFGFVEYAEASSALEAVAKYHEGHFLGAQIKVELSHAKSGAKSAPVNDEGKVIERNPPGSDRPSDKRKPMHINGPPGANQNDRRRGAPPGNQHNNYNNAPPASPYDNAPLYYDAPRPPYEYNRFGPPPQLSGPPPPPPRGDVQYDRIGRDAPPLNPYADPRYPGEYDRYGAPPPPRDLRGPPQGYPLVRDRPYDAYYDAPRDYSGYGAAPAYGGHPPMLPDHARQPYGAPLLRPPPRDLYGAPPEPYLDHYAPPLNSAHFDRPAPMGYPPRDAYPRGGDRYDPRGGPPRDDRRYTPYPRPTGNGRPADADNYHSPRNGAAVRRSASPARHGAPTQDQHPLPRRPVSPPRDYRPAPSTVPLDEYTPRR